MLGAAKYAILALAIATGVESHITLWHASLFGFNYPDPGSTDPRAQNWNTNAAVSPLRRMDNLTVENWFAHGYKNLTPIAGAFLELPVGKSATFELSCNRAFTSSRDPNHQVKIPDMACDGDTGPLHNANKIGKPLNASLFGGTAIAIAYTSDVAALKPEDMTIISVNSTSPWTRLTNYDFPKNLPPCPEGGCLCTWNWIHLSKNGEGYGAEMYNTLYRCKTTGDVNRKYTVPRGKVAVECANAPDKCVTGPKTGMYIHQVDGNNMQPPPAGYDNPSYDMRYGWKDGAQEDAVVSGSSTSTSGDPSASVPSVGDTQNGGVNGAGALAVPAMGTLVAAFVVGTVLV